MSDEHDHKQPCPYCGEIIECLDYWKDNDEILFLCPWCKRKLHLFVDYGHYNLSNFTDDDYAAHVKYPSASVTDMIAGNDERAEGFKNAVKSVFGENAVLMFDEEMRAK